MINFDNIENSLRCEIADDNGDGSCDLTNTALLELITRLRQAEKDAARYRWLIGNGTLDSDRDGNCELHFRVGSPINTMDLETIIDEAMQCK